MTQIDDIRITMDGRVRIVSNPQEWASLPQDSGNWTEQGQQPPSWTEQ